MGSKTTPIHDRCPRRRYLAARDGTSAFTLVELLFVIGIIAYLIALLMPTLRTAKMAAQQTRCASNLRQIGFAIVMYADANRAWIPRDATNDRSDRAPWPLLLAPYLGSRKDWQASELSRFELLQCPSHPLTDIPTGYVINAFAFETAPQWAPDGPVKITSIRRSSELPWLLDAANDFPFRDISLPDKIYGLEFHDVYDPRHLPDGERHRISDIRHNQRGNVMFLDTHVETIPKGGFRLEMFDDGLTSRPTTAPVTELP